MRRAVGMLFHPRVDPGLAALAPAREALTAAGVDVWEVARDVRAREMASRLRDTALVVTLGGDGTLLYGARLAAPARVPLLGVNLGRLGFLTELEVDGLAGGLRRFLAGDYRIEERTLLVATATSAGRRRARQMGLNEVVVQRSGQRLVRLHITAGGHEVGVIDSDGALVATATGSTAYALAAGGPILVPTIEDLVLVPMAPFALTVRPIVFPPRQALTIELERGEAAVSVDGGPTRRLLEGDRVTVRGYGRRLRMVRFGVDGGFYGMVRRKLGWGLPLVPTP